MITTSAYRYIVAIFMLFLLLPACGGVVEDAEEELKRLHQKQRESQAGVQVQVPIAPGETGSSGRDVDSRSSRGPDQRGNGTKTSSAPRQAANATGSVSPEETKEPPSKTYHKKNTQRQKKDRLLSIFGILVLLALIVGAAVFSRTSGSRD